MIREDTAAPVHADRPLRSLVPWWVHAMDASALVVAGALLWRLVAGDFVIAPFGIRISAKSITGLAERLLVVVVVRHLVRRTPSILVTSRAYWRAGGRLLARWPTLRDVLPVTMGSRLAVLVVGYAAVLTIGVPDELPFRISDDPLLNLPARWDAGWYLQIATDGYFWNPRPRQQINVAFFPAYPVLLRALGLFRLTTADAAVVLWLGVAASIVMFVAAAVYLVRLARFLGLADDRATGSVILLATYPFALFYSAPYTESLFLLASVGACYHQHRHQPWPTAVWGLVAGLCRPNGVVLGGVLGLIALADARRVACDAHARGRSAWPAWPALRPTLALLLAAMAPAAGMLIYCGVNWWNSGHPLLWLTAQRVGWGRTTAGFEKVETHLAHVFRHGLLDFAAERPFETSHLLAVTLGLAAIVPVWHRFGVPYGALVALNLGIPLAFGGLLSLARFSSVLFPVFPWLAAALGPRGRTALAVTFAAGQGLAAALFFTWRSLY